MKFYGFCRFRIVIILQQSSAAITQSNITWYGTQHNSDWNKTYIKSHHSQKAPHISPSWVSYGVSIVRIWEKINHLIMALHCITCSILLSWDFISSYYLVWGNMDIYGMRKMNINVQFLSPLLRLCLTHWGRVTHICVGKLTNIGSDNGLSPGRRQAIIWTNAGISFIGPFGTNFSEILIGIQTFSFKKMHLKMSSAKWRPVCLGLNELTLVPGECGSNC